jgi:hypothetical protein
MQLTALVFSKNTGDQRMIEEKSKYLRCKPGASPIASIAAMCPYKSHGIAV